MKVRQYEREYGVTYSPRQPIIRPFDKLNLYFYPEHLTPEVARQRINEEMARKQARFANLSEQPASSLTVQERYTLAEYKRLQEVRAGKQVFSPRRR